MELNIQQLNEFLFLKKKRFKFPQGKTTPYKTTRTALRHHAGICIMVWGADVKIITAT